jgi:hypothetical protein
MIQVSHIISKKKSRETKRHRTSAMNIFFNPGHFWFLSGVLAIKKKPKAQGSLWIVIEHR